MTPDREPFTPDAGPAAAVWPLFGLRLVAQDLDLRPVREHDAVALAALLPDDAELDPGSPRPGLGEGPEGRAAMAMQTMWRMWAGWTPQQWALPFAVRVRGELVGMQVLEGSHFAALRTVDSASWLVPSARRRGTGRRMREAVLTFAFGTLGARYAITSAWSDNAASLGVSGSLGYVGNGVERHLRPGTADGAGDMVHLRLSREDWRPGAAGDVRVLGFEPCRLMFGLDPATRGA